MEEYLTPEQRSVLSGLNTPNKIQEYLDKVHTIVRTSTAAGQGDG